MAKMDRRGFLKSGSIATVGTYLAGSTRTHLLAAPVAEPAKPIAANDHIQIALIGAGGQGQGDTKVAAMVPGVKVVAAADCYDGCLQHARELWGKDILTTRDYNEILARKDIDAVIIGTPDHWHMKASIDAMNAGKDVYCEKPMIHLYSDGPKIIEAWRKTNRIMQIGSQRVSSIVYHKAKELLAAGAIGELNMVTVWYDRNSAQGAWEYTVPYDADTTTCDWPRFLGTAPKVPFGDGQRFFQWRKYKDYGTGVAGDLFVHLFSGVHLITNTTGPTRAMSTGGLRFWKDGRDVPDVMISLYDYAKGFNLSVRTNFVDGGSESEGFVFTGSEGSMTLAGDTVTIARVPREKEPGVRVGLFGEATQKRMMEIYREKYPVEHPTGEALRGEEKYVAPKGYSDHYDHMKNWIDAIRTRQPITEDPVFGFRAAGTALLSNVSYESGKIAHWDPDKMELL
ncbi:MAG: Gfo/Idh/MocA family oxidoreductase [Acidobacteriota bacterium]|nr:Gfo/Idh/MocA family oxidoreductase [Acidobacteriota bacterium]